MSMKAFFSRSCLLLYCVLLLVVEGEEAVKKPIEGLFLNVHITHHAGTNLWRLATKNGLASDGMDSNYNLGKNSNCKGGAMTKEETLKAWISPVTNDTKSWCHRALGVPVKPLRMRQYVSVEQSLTGDVFNAIPLENRTLVHSMIVMRNPLMRSLAGGPEVSFRKADHPNTKKWHSLGAFLKGNSNYAIYQLTGLPNLSDAWHKAPKKNSKNRSLTENDYKLAVARLYKFDHVIIQEAMDETSYFICSEWNWQYCVLPPSSALDVTHPRERIANDTLYKELLGMEYYWDYRLYDTAVNMSKAQMNQKGLPNPELDALGSDSRLQLQDDLRLSRTKAPNLYAARLGLPKGKQLAKVLMHKLDKQIKKEEKKEVKKEHKMEVKLEHKMNFSYVKEKKIDKDPKKEEPKKELKKAKKSTRKEALEEAITEAMQDVEGDNIKELALSGVGPIMNLMETKEKEKALKEARKNAKHEEKAGLRGT